MNQKLNIWLSVHPLLVFGSQVLEGLVHALHPRAKTDPTKGTFLPAIHYDPDESTWMRISAISRIPNSDPDFPCLQTKVALVYGFVLVSLQRGT